MKIGVIADCQFALGVEVYLDRHPALSLEKLREAVSAFAHDPEMGAVLNLGDLIDHGAPHFVPATAAFEALEVPVYHVLGNHDFYVADHEKVSVPERLGLPQRYYSVPLAEEGWRLVVLDGTAESKFGHPRESVAWGESVEVWERMEPRPEDWNGGVGTEQLAWLDDVLTAAREGGEQVLVACHWPLLPEGERYLLWDALGVRNILEDFPATVAAYFCGHHHAGGTAELAGGIPHINFVGMVDTRENAFASAAFTAWGLRISGAGRQPDYAQSRTT